MLSCAQSVAQSNEHTERISRAFTLANGAASVLVIYNVQGCIHVEGTAGDRVTVDVDKRLKAKDPQTLDVGKREFKLQMEQRGDTILAYIAEPFDSRPRRNWRSQDDRRIDYDFTLDFTVKVPRAMNLNVSTVNRGDVAVRDVAGSLRVRNVNGAISLTNVRGLTDVHTVNGNVEANYLANPPANSSYYTLNGDIKVTYPATLSADVQFKTFQGHFNTDFTDVAVLPAKVVKSEEQRGDKTIYKVDRATSVRIGSGGPPLRFETFNGNVYIKKQS